MKKFVVSLVSVFTLLVPTQALAVNWIQVDERLFVDVDSINVKKTHPHIRYFSEKIVLSDRPGFVIRHRETNCGVGQVRLLEEVFYDNIGRPFRSIKHVRNKGVSVTGPVGANVLNIVCQ